MHELWARFMPNEQHALNRTEWWGKEPRSCAVTGVKSRPHSVGDSSPVIIDIEVTYRPKGYITYVGNTKYDGWTAMVIDQTRDGVLLDGHGQPLKDGDPPVYLPHEVYPDAEFNDMDFGEFVGEFDVEDVEHTTVDAVMKELTASGKFGGSLHGSFIAPHRSRPLTKIILSSAPTSQGVDGFGTRILNVNNSTPHLEQVLMEMLTNLMCEFIEGKASVKSMGKNDLTFVELSDSLVDCAPNEDGLDSWFDILHCCTPAGFLEDLAKRLMSVYAIEVAVVDGEKCGLVLRHEAKEA